MLRDNFGYNGSNDTAKEFVDTINQMAKILNGLKVDMGGNRGGTDIVNVIQKGDGLVLDLRNVEIQPPTPPVP